MTLEDVVSIAWIIISAIIGFVGGYFYKQAKDAAKDEDNSLIKGQMEVTVDHDIGRPIRRGFITRQKHSKLFAEGIEASDVGVIPCRMGMQQSHEAAAQKKLPGKRQAVKPGPGFFGKFFLIPAYSPDG